ncbi:hypothetical protein CYMTET_13159 [Cymbomonas tetramitiformis]|uniref:Uncharacterized protein n=1 Tax=Cymbomonas tetramitiformis TaxID=36881 RepID=A0AAE0GJ14_9CHLO|nr:hypothetical protein CYMTET_13159 [Cymbomonas tetramitiformis]
MELENSPRNTTSLTAVIGFLVVLLLAAHRTFLSSTIVRSRTASKDPCAAAQRNHQGGPRNACKFCNRPSHRFHHPTLPCHISGKTSMYQKWISEGKMPIGLKQFKDQLMVNHERVNRNEIPFTRDKFLQRFPQHLPPFMNPHKLEKPQPHKPRWNNTRTATRTLRTNQTTDA